MSGTRGLPPFEQSLSANLIQAREAVLAPFRPVLRAHNVTEPQWRVLRVVNEHAATDATGLAEAGLLHAPSVTRILKELEERGLIERRADLADRRRSTIVLSSAGRALIHSISRPAARILRDFSDRFGAERLDRLVSELRALSGAIQGVE